MSDTKSNSWADDERDEGVQAKDDQAQGRVPANETQQNADQERRHQLARELEERLLHRTPTPQLRLATPTTLQSSVRTAEQPMQEVQLKFMDLSGSLKPGGMSSVIPGPTYYRARSANSAKSRLSNKTWRYFNAEESKFITRSKTDLDQQPKSRKNKTAPVRPSRHGEHSRSEDLNRQCSLSNKLLNVMTIDDYQERYYGHRVKKDNKYGHHISRASSASTNTKRNATPDISVSNSRPGSSRPSTSSKTESGIYEDQSEDEDQEKELTQTTMPLEYFAMLDHTARNQNKVVERGFQVLMNSNECLHSRMARRQKSSLRASDGSDFFHRLTATLRYQILVGNGLPTKSRHRRAANLHPLQDDGQEIT